LARVKLNGKYGFIDTTGHLVVEIKYDYSSDFKENLAPVAIRINEKGYFLDGYTIEGIIDRQGKEIIPFEKHVSYKGFTNGLIQGRRYIFEDKKYTGKYELFYMNKKGEKVWEEVLAQ
jgi:hypothetical protein